MSTISDLRQQAATIKNATQVGENTATRVGTTFETIADLLEGASVGQGVPSVDLSQLNALRTPADQTTTNPTIYNVTTLHNLSSTTIKVGTLFIFSDGGRAVVTQILLSNYQVDGGGNISSPNTSQITMYYRMFNIVQETWSAWTLYAGGGGGGTIDPYPVSGSDNAVASNGVFEGLQKAAPEVNINDLDDLGDFVDMRTGESSAYTLKYMHTQSSTWLRVGVVMCFANQAQNTLTQIVFSNCVVDGGGNLIPNSTTNVMNVFYRFKQFSGNPPEGMTIGVWTTWAKFGDSGYQPNNEDIDLNANDQLQFANKAYDASAFSGLGRVYLRKNIVQLNLTDKYFDGFVNDVLVQDVGTSSTPDAILFDTTRKMFVARVGLLYYVDWSSDEDYNPITRDVNWNYNGNFYRWNGEELVQWDKTINQLTQAMVNTANTIYHIQYDYDLNGETITLPAGCVLKFNGGKVSNGTLNGNETSFNDEYNIFGTDLTLRGNWKIPYIEPKWFGAIGYGNVFAGGENTPIKSDVTLIDSTIAVKKAIEATFTTTVNHLHFDKLYVISDELEFNVYTLIGGSRYSVTGEGNLSGIISTIDDSTKYIMAFDKDINRNVFYYTIENFSIYNVGNSAKGGLRTTNTIRTSVSDITVFGCRHSFAEGCFSFYVVGNLNSFANTYLRLKGICTSSGHGIYLNCNSAYYGWTLTDIRCCCFQAMYGGFGIFEEPVDSSIVPGGSAVAHTFSGIVEHNELEGNLYGAMFFSATSAIFRKNYGESGRTRYNPYNEDEEHGLQQAPYYIGIMHNSSQGLWAQLCNNVTFENNSWSSGSSGNTEYMIGFPNVFSTYSQQIDNCQFLYNHGSFNYLTRFDNAQFVRNNIVKGSILPLVLRCSSNNIFEGGSDGIKEMRSLDKVSTFIRNKIVFSFRDSDNYFVYNKGVCPFLYAGELVAYYSITEGERFLSHGIWFKVVKGGKIHRQVAAAFVSGSNILVANYSSQFSIGDHINSPFITGGEGYITAKSGNNVTISIDAEGTTPCNAIATVDDWLYDALILPDVNQAPIFGSTSSRPTFKTYRIYEGFQYFDTTLNKQIYWNGANWIDQHGELADIARSGTFANVPTPTNVGFQYFCTSGASIDGGTTEKTNIAIYYTGSGWVDANGNAVVSKA